MEVSRIIAEIDAQIAKLQQARALLADTEKVMKGPGRPKGSKNVIKARRRHTLSAEGRRRISESQKRRWAEQRKAASKSGSAKSAAAK
ncbi:MAG TPA: hypothetical protein VG714_03925 [Acidobacteriaceae bacterium]|nr:hypothetical protein [Acidobacteriaceae bacterium]